jgi:hypothetical protein
MAATGGPSFCWMAAGEAWDADVPVGDDAVLLEAEAIVANVLARATEAVPAEAVLVPLAELELELDPLATAPYSIFK